MLVNAGDHAVLRQQFRDSAVHPFGRSAVIGAKIKDQGVIQQALAFQAAPYTLTDQLDQILQVTSIRRFDALASR